MTHYFVTQVKENCKSAISVKRQTSFFIASISDQAKLVTVFPLSRRSTQLRSQRNWQSNDLHLRCVAVWLAFIQPTTREPGFAGRAACSETAYGGNVETERNQNNRVKTKVHWTRQFAHSALLPSAQRQACKQTAGKTLNKFSHAREHFELCFVVGNFKFTFVYNVV